MYCTAHAASYVTSYKCTGVCTYESKRVTGGGQLGESKKLIFCIKLLGTIHRYTKPQARNPSCPHLCLTVNLQFHLIPHCRLIDSQKQSIPMVKLLVFHQQQHILLVSPVHPHHNHHSPLLPHLL